MGSIGVWSDALHEDVGGMLAAAGYGVASASARDGIAGDWAALVADAAVLADHADAVARAKARSQRAYFPVLAVLPAGAGDATVADALAVADEVIRRPLGEAELAARVGRLLAALPGNADDRGRRQAVVVAGIARDIITPVQYVGGNLEFLGNTLGRLLELLDALAERAMEAPDALDDGSLAEELTRLLGDEELRFFLGEAPTAIRESKEGLDRVTGFVQSLTRFVGPGSGRPEPLELDQAVADVLAVSRSAWRFAAAVTVDIDAGLPAILFVPGEFHRMLYNLVVTAAAAMEAQAQGGQGHIEIRATQNGPVVELAVIDNGPGQPEAMARQNRDSLSAFADEDDNGGQGLVALKALAARNMARLDILSAPGRGTTVLVTLPAAGQTALEASQRLP